MAILANVKRRAALSPSGWLGATSRRVNSSLVSGGIVAVQNGGIYVGATARRRHGILPTVKSQKARSPREMAALMTLGLSDNASQDDIRRSKRKMIKMIHPDTQGQKIDSTDKLAAVLLAAEILLSTA